VEKNLILVILSGLLLGAWALWTSQVLFYNPVLTPKSAITDEKPQNWYIYLRSHCEAPDYDNSFYGTKQEAVDYFMKDLHEWGREEVENRTTLVK